MFKMKNDLSKKLQQVENETISSIIDGSMSINGEISFKGKTRIDGIVTGNISGEHLVLSQHGKIIGDIKVSSFICHGTIEGNIFADMATASKGCSINGRLEVENLTVEPGAAIEGEVKIAAESSVVSSTEKKTLPASDSKSTA